MGEFDSYARPYCKNCRLIWGSQNIGLIRNCNKCGQDLILKSFNPWSQCIKGLGIISIGGFTLLSGIVPIIWVGGFLWGIQLIFHGFKQWNKVKKLDEGSNSNKDEQLQVDSNHVIITCGKCNQKLRFSKGKGVIKIRCPSCLGEYRIQT